MEIFLINFDCCLISRVTQLNYSLTFPLKIFIIHGKHIKGVIDYLTGPSLDAAILRDNFVFKIIPMLNPDGVIVGNYRCSLAGSDLNRNYIAPLRKLHPTIFRKFPTYNNSSYTVPTITSLTLTSLLFIIPIHLLVQTPSK